ncbi:MAG TPA: hypothetical protein VLE96_02865 [Chlamydiales bacterium]|nr:hypothetical protein [Chlamydiales bacterium]
MQKEPDTQEWEVLNETQKKELAFYKLSQGEFALLQGNLVALSLFEESSHLEPKNPQIWYRQGLAFFEYGSEEGKEKALLLASKYFKFATTFDPSFFEAYVAWGNTFLQLGKCHEEHHYLLEAKEKYQKAILLSSNQSEDILSELYWDYGNVWMEIAAHSGEAIDIRSAIAALQTSYKLQKALSSEFLHDCGKAHLEMGLLVNDSRLLTQAVQYFMQAVQKTPNYYDGWVSLGEVYSQLYINTMDDRYTAKASQSYGQAVKLSGKDADTWISWAQILGEGGRINQDIRALRQSIENCARAFLLDAKNPLITAQWVESLSYLGLASNRLDLLIEAENKIIKATDAEDNPDLWHAYGVCLMCFGKYYEDGEFYDMAIEKLQYALSIDRTAAEHWHTLGLVHKYYADLTDHDDLLMRANRFFARAIDLKPSCPAIVFDAACSLLHYSELVKDLPSLQLAMQHFETLLQAHKEVILHHPEWLYMYAKSLVWLAEFNHEEAPLIRALEVFSQVLLIDPDHPDIHYQIALQNMNLGVTTEETDFYKRALPFFRLAARQEEENDQVWLDWGICLINLALTTFDSEFATLLYADAEQKIALAGSLGNASAYYTLACLYSLQGRIEESMQLIRHSLSLKSLPPLEELLEDEWLEALRNTESFAQFIDDLEAKFQTRED